MKDRIPTKPNRYAVYDDNHNFIRYEYHERADEPTHAGDALNKANLLPDAVTTALALDPADNPQVKDALQCINSNFTDTRKTWWKKYTAVLLYTEALGNNEEVEFGTTASNVTTLSITVYSGISIDSVNGTFALIGPSSKSIANGTDVSGLYVYGLDNSIAYKLTGTVTVTNNYGISNSFSASGKLVSLVQSPTEKTHGTFIENVCSYAGTTYPADGSQEDFWYTLIGKNAIVAAQTEVGSYVGTGKKFTSITFSAPPKMVIVANANSSSSENMGVWIDNITQSNLTTVSGMEKNWTLNGNTLECNASSARYALNAVRNTYFYLGIY